jgi:predicted kinase
LYEDRSTRATYDELARAAVAIIDAGLAAIMDATFQRRSDRATYAALAERRGARLALVQCEAPLAILQARVAQRLASGHDASDATRDVLAHQLAGFEWPAGDEAPFVHPIDTDTDAATLAARCDQLAATLDAGAPPHA